MKHFDGDDGQRAIVLSLVFWAAAFVLIYQWFGYKARAIEAERQHSEAQLRLLQAQIEPHFLFNTLANVNALIEHDPPKARRMLGAFTDYLRAGLSNLRRDQAPLADELALAEAYLRVQQARMEERLSFSIEADPTVRQAALPPLLLQPLVENAVVHGLEPQVDGGTVQVQARIEQGCLVLEVRDNGRGLAPPAAAQARRGQGLALANVRERLRSRFGDAASLELLDAEPGALARLRLPLEAG
jgi:sensor histidine kinase YesM